MELSEPNISPVLPLNSTYNDDTTIDDHGELVSSCSSTSSSKDSSSNNEDRRKKIGKYLKDERHNRLSKKLSLENQQLKLAREDLELKRKLLDRIDQSDADFKDSMSKMAKCIEHVGNTIAQSFASIHATNPQRPQVVTYDLFPNVSNTVLNQRGVRVSEVNDILERAFRGQQVK